MCRLSINELKLIEDAMREKLEVLRNRAPLTNLSTRAALLVAKLGETRQHHERAKRQRVNQRERNKRAAARAVMDQPGLASLMDNRAMLDSSPF